MSNDSKQTGPLTAVELCTCSQDEVGVKHCQQQAYYNDFTNICSHLNNSITSGEKITTSGVTILSLYQ